MDNLAFSFSLKRRGSLTFKFNRLIIEFREKCSKQNMKKAVLEIVFVCEDFSLNRKENELHRKYKAFWRSTENFWGPPILEIEQNGWFHWIYHVLECTCMSFCSFRFENKFYIIFWTSCTFFTKKKTFLHFFFLNYHLIRLLSHRSILTSFLFKMNLVPSL